MRKAPISIGAFSTQAAFWGAVIFRAWLASRRFEATSFPPSLSFPIGQLPARFS